jgi:hypothetical protein
MACMAVTMPTSAVMPKAIMAMVIPLRSVLLRSERKERERMSECFMQAFEDKQVVSSETARSLFAKAAEKQNPP